MSNFTYSYRCAAGHEITAPVHLHVGRCPVYVLGKPCPAVIKRIGKGSRTANRKAEVDA